VNSEPGHGSAFHIFLPVTETAATVGNCPIFITDLPVRGGTETILLAEDHEGVREMAQVTLESLGYRILIAHDGEEAVEMFQLTATPSLSSCWMSSCRVAADRKFMKRSKP
jgi:two-component system, cell cycle sensor histidine kinase and response regulator CckA